MNKTPKTKPTDTPGSYQLALLPVVAFSVFDELPHVLVPLVFCVFGLVDQGQLLLHPLLTLSLVLLCTQLDTIPVSIVTYFGTYG